MWRFSRTLLRGATAVRAPPPAPRAACHYYCFSSAPWPSRAASEAAREEEEEETVTAAEARRLMRLVNVEALKRRLGGGEVIAYRELLRACEEVGAARTRAEAAALAGALDEAGVVLLFRDKVFLRPDKVVDLVRQAVPLALTPENDPRKEELSQLQKQKDEIDRLAHKQVRIILMTGLAVLIGHVGILFRLTFWDLSWDVMEPITFFLATTALVIGYAYFIVTSRDPTYRDCMDRLFVSRQRKLMQKHKFNVERFLELQRCCCSDPLEKLWGTNGHLRAEGSPHHLHDMSLHK